MSEQTSGSASGALPLPDAPNLDWLRKQAKRQLDELRKANPGAQLADAQFDLAKQYGFTSWRALKAHVDSLTLDGQLFDAARKGDVDALAALLDEAPGEAASARRSRTSGRCCTRRHTPGSSRSWNCCCSAAST